MIMKRYIFRSERLGFRTWLPADLEKMAEINADPEVMRYFPALQTREQTAAFIERMNRQFSEKGYCYFAADTLDTGALTGFIGLSLQEFESDFTPCVDIGWRLAAAHWNKGLATEGAARCLAYAFEVLALEKIVAMAPLVNIPSEKVMKKIGMARAGTFLHPRLSGNLLLENCVAYTMTEADYRKNIKA